MVRNEYKNNCRKPLKDFRQLYIYSKGTACVNKYIVPLFYNFEERSDDPMYDKSHLLGIARL